MPKSQAPNSNDQKTGGGRPLGLPAFSDRSKDLSLHFAIVLNLTLGILILLEIWGLKFVI